MKHATHLLLTFALIPALLSGQDETVNQKRWSYLFETSHGLSSMYREAKSNTNVKTFEVTPSYTYSYNVGINKPAKNKNYFSTLTLGYSSVAHGVNGIVDIQSPTGFSSNTSYNRTNFLTIGYRRSRYVHTFSDWNSFFGLGLDFSYVLNETNKLNFEQRSAWVRTKGKDISYNVVLPTSPAISISYGVEFDRGLFNLGGQSRLRLEIARDMYLFGFRASPANQYNVAQLSYGLQF